MTVKSAWVKTMERPARRRAAPMRRWAPMAFVQMGQSLGESTRP
jgi:hypothetical protein